jgi:hypothetical protein
MGRISRRAQARRTAQIISAAVIALLLLLVAGGVAYYLINRPKDLNSQTLCPAGGPTAHVALLIDTTDPMTFTQKEAFAVLMRRLVDREVPEGALLSVFALGEDFKQGARPLIEMCNPGNGTGKSELTANPRQLREQYEIRFLRPVTEQVDLLVKSQPAKSSPIFEMLQLVGINGFQKHDVPGAKRLILLSDMLHNTPNFTMYSGQLDYPAFAASDYGRKSRLQMPGVDVEIHYLINAPKLQTKRNLKFWEDYFNEAGAKVVSVKPLEG